MNKNILLCLALAGFLTASAGPVSACPKGEKGEGRGRSSMVLKHSKELGLSKKQKSQIEKIRNNFKHDMKELGKKYGDETRAVLTKAQNKKFDQLKMKEHEGHKKGKEGDYCPMHKK